VTVTRDRHGLPGRSVLLDIHYLGEGERSVAAQVQVTSPSVDKALVRIDRPHLAVA
jgi:hypothetical protein